MKNTIILFDLDGTLIDSTEAILESFRVAYDAFGETVPPRKAITALIGKPLHGIFSDLGISQDRIAKYVQAFREHYGRISQSKTVLLPGVRTAVERAAAFAHLGIVTTKNGHFSRQLMEHFKLMEFFDVLIGEEDVRHPKPHPEPIQKALQALPAVTGRRYMVGDTCMDMAAAQASGTVGMGVLCGYSSRAVLTQCTENLFENVPDAVTQIAKG